MWRDSNRKSTVEHIQKLTEVCKFLLRIIVFVPVQAFTTSVWGIFPNHWWKKDIVLVPKLFLLCEKDTFSVSAILKCEYWYNQSTSLKNKFPKNYLFRDKCNTIFLDTPWSCTCWVFSFICLIKNSIKKRVSSIIR